MMNLRNLIYRCVPASILIKKFLHNGRGKTLVLMYHDVLPDYEGTPAWTVVKKSEFILQLKFLKKYCDIISIDQAYKRVISGSQYQKPAVVLTFDDGYSGNFSHVFPVIKELQVPITVYVSTMAVENQLVNWYDKIIALLDYKSRIDIDLSMFGLGHFFLNIRKGEKDRWMRIQPLLNILKTVPVQQLDEIIDFICKHYPVAVRMKMMNVGDIGMLSSSKLVTIGGHSHCHNILTRLSDASLQQNLQDNRTRLELWAGREIEHFSYPNGDYDHRVIAAVRQMGFRSAVTTRRGLWKLKEEVWTIPRYGVGRFDTFKRYIAALAQLT